MARWGGEYTNSLHLEVEALLRLSWPEAVVAVNSVGVWGLWTGWSRTSERATYLKSAGEGMLAGRVQYTPNKMKHHYGIYHRKVDVPALHVTRKLTPRRIIRFFHSWQTLAGMSQKYKIEVPVFSLINSGSWLRHCATSRKVASSIPDEVIASFSWPNPSSCTMAMGLTRPLTEMSTRSLPGGKGRPARKADNLTAMCEPIF
jgi:hypothetical protein